MRGFLGSVGNRALGFLRAACMLAFVAGFVVSPTPAKAVNVEVGGFIYDVQFSAGNVGFSGGLRTSVMNSAWWGNSTLASQFRTAVNNLGTVNFDFSGSTVDLTFYAHAELGVNSVTAQWRREDGFGGNGNFGVPNAAYRFAFATLVGPVMVPEINGSSLAKMLMVVMVAYVMLIARRRVHSSH